MDREYEIKVFDPDTGGAAPLGKDSLRKIMSDDDEIDDDLVVAILQALAEAADGTVQAVPCTEATDDDVLVHHGEGCLCGEG